MTSRAGAVAALLGLLLLAGLAPPGLSAPAPSAPRGGRTQRQNVLLITVESLRADHLGCYTAGQKSTPGIDALARRGTRFERAYTASVSTGPAVATVLTGVYPLKHALRGDLGGRLAPGVQTLAAALGKAGYWTGAVMGSFHVDSDHSLERGFQKYDDTIEGLVKKVAGRSKERRADEVVSRGLAFLDAQKKRRQPFFLWLDFYDPHYDYEAPDPLKKQFETDPYSGEVAHLDAQIGVLMDGLRSRDLERTTDILFVGTHGEGLGDHGETGHGAYLFETTARVPLMVIPAPARTVAAPAGQGAAQGSDGVKEPVSLIDITPTIYALEGVPAPTALDGRSLANLLPGAAVAAPVEHRRLFVEAMEPLLAYGWSPLYAVIEGDRKIVQGTRLEAFDLAADPGETKPIMPLPGWAESLKSYGQALARAPELSAPEKKRILDAAAALKLPWNDRPTCLEKNTFADPRDRIDLNDRLFRARVAFDQGMIGTASTLSTEVLQSDPGNFTALELVSFLLVRNGPALMLLDALEVLQCNYPYRGSAYHIYGHEMEKERKYAEAEQALNVFKLIYPDSEEPYYDLASIYAWQDQKDKAFEYLAKAIKFGAHDYAFIWRDGRLAKIKQDPRFAKLVGPPPPPKYRPPAAAGTPPAPAVAPPAPSGTPAVPPATPPGS